MMSVGLTVSIFVFSVQFTKDECAELLELTAETPSLTRIAPHAVCRAIDR